MKPTAPSPRCLSSRSGSGLAREGVAWLEQADPARPEDVKAGRDAVRIVERGDAEVDRLGLVVDLHQEGRAALAAEAAAAEGARLERPDLVRALGPDEVPRRHGRERHRRRAGIEPAGAAMAPAAIAGLALEPVSNRAARAAAFMVPVHGQACYAALERQATGLPTRRQPQATFEIVPSGAIHRSRKRIRFPSEGRSMTLKRNLIKDGSDLEHRSKSPLMR